MTEREELELLKSKSPYALPDNTATSGWSTSQIKAKFYEGLIYLYELFKDNRSDVASKIQDLIDSLNELNTKVVHNTGNETINGFKEFPNGISVKGLNIKNKIDSIETNKQNKLTSANAGENITIEEDREGRTIISSTGGGGASAVNSVNGQTGDVVLDADDIEYDTDITIKDKVDFISDEVDGLEDSKVDKEVGKGLSTNDLTNERLGKINDVDRINSYIPTQASTTNKLADKDFVNSTINSLAAFYITKDAAGNPFDTYAQLSSATVVYSGGEVRIPTKNDYCLVNEDETHNNKACRYIYSNQWQFQFVVNDTPFTSQQLAALNSGITSAMVGAIPSSASSSNKLVTSNEVPQNTSDLNNDSGFSVVSGQHDGTKWTEVTINGVSKNIPSGSDDAYESVDITNVDNMGELKDLIDEINTDGRHCFFDLSSYISGAYVCTIQMYSENNVNYCYIFDLLNHKLYGSLTGYSDNESVQSYAIASGNNNDIPYIIKITDVNTTLADAIAMIDRVNTLGHHVFLDVSSLNTSDYLITFTYASGETITSFKTLGLVKGSATCKGYANSDLETTTLKALLETAGHLGASFEVTYAELVALKTNSLLISGSYYRITDYVTKTNSNSYYKSVEHPFDIIVKANSEKSLSPNATAKLHSGDSYFSSHKIETWQLLYSLENDNNKYLWADTATGKGVIYYMKDANNNECEYDFKNIQFKPRWSESGLNTDEWYYTFPNSRISGNTDNSISNLCQYNKIINCLNPNNIAQYQLPEIIAVVNNPVISNTFNGSYKCYLSQGLKYCSFTNAYKVLSYTNLLKVVCENGANNIVFKQNSGQFENCQFGKEIQNIFFGGNYNYAHNGIVIGNNVRNINVQYTSLKNVTFEDGVRDIYINKQKTTQTHNELENVVFESGVYEINCARNMLNCVFKRGCSYIQFTADTSLIGSAFQNITFEGSLKGSSSSRKECGGNENIAKAYDIRIYADQQGVVNSEYYDDKSHKVVKYYDTTTATWIDVNTISPMYITTEPTADNTNGLKIVVLSSEPATKYDGYIYIITS